MKIKKSEWDDKIRIRSYNDLCKDNSLFKFTVESYNKDNFDVVELTEKELNKLKIICIKYNTKINSFQWKKKLIDLYEIKRKICSSSSIEKAMFIEKILSNENFNFRNYLNTSYKDIYIEICNIINCYPEYYDDKETMIKYILKFEKLENYDIGYDIFDIINKYYLNNTDYTENKEENNNE